MATLDEARQLHRVGRIAEALAIYAAHSEAPGATAEHWKMRAMAEHQLRQLDAASTSIARAQALDPADAGQHLIAGHIAEDRRDFAAAERSFRAAIEARPDWVAALNALGTRLLEDRRFAEAAETFQRSVTLEGKSARAWNNLGLAQLGLEKFDDAVRSFDFAVSLDPRHALAHLNLARVHEARGEGDRALASIRAALQADPKLVEGHLLLGDMLRKRRDRDGARRSYAAAVALAPQAVKPGNALAEFLWEEGLASEARRLFGEVAARHPGNFKAALGSRLLLPPLYDSPQEVIRARTAYEAGLSELIAGADRFRYTDAGAALADVRWTNFYLAYQGGDDREPQRRYGELVKRVLEPVVPEWLAPRPRRGKAGNRVRVGFFSFFFFNCTAGRYFASWIHGLDPARFERFVYYTNPWIADDTRAIAASAEHFRHMPAWAPNRIAPQVLADDLDILVYPELGMHADTFGLASLRLAPVQAAGWGHPTTTGLPSIDWFLSSAPMEPEGAQSFYSERLHLLPGLGTRYAMPSGAESGTRADFGLPDDANLYLVPQSLFKIHPDNDALFAALLQRDARGKLVVFAASHPSVTNQFATRLDRALRAAGSNVSDRVIFLPFMSHAAYLGLNAVCDVMIDTLHWSGGNTSLDALAMGLPIVTLPGRFMRGRQSQAMLDIVGVPELVASDVDSFVEKAVAIATDRAYRRELSARILAGRPALFDRPEPVAAFAGFLENAAASQP